MEGDFLNSHLSIYLENRNVACGTHEATAVDCTVCLLRVEQVATREALLEKLFELFHRSSLLQEACLCAGDVFP